MENFTPYSAVIGGALIGTAATLLLWLNGQIAGVSGIVQGAIKMHSPDRLWRILFLAGLVCGGSLWLQIMGPSFTPRDNFPLLLLLIAGTLVGFGSRIGNGCTSGHGVCGLGRTSGRSAAATVTFFSVALATTFIVQHVLGGIS
ncbi:MAG TPA: YeeE/YedE family protein [Gammaproteobacteria bacterium]|nr:YeeE/YedE family protein [Gammaproteobacteria bacterium]